MESLTHLNWPRLLPINGSGHTAPDLCCAAAQAHFLQTSALRKAQPGENVDGAEGVSTRVFRRF